MGVTVWGWELKKMRRFVIVNADMKNRPMTYEKKKIWYRCLFTALTILWMTVIFSFSAQPADDSSETSQGVGTMIARIFVAEYDSWEPEEQQAFVAQIDHPVRKAGHMTEYVILGALVTVTLYSYGWRGKKMYVAAFGIGAFYAATDEFHQLFVSGRGAQITDVFIDSCGVALGVLLVLAVWNLRERRRTVSKERR